MTARQDKKVKYSMRLKLQGGPHLQVILDRVLSEMGEMRDGPGEEEMERLAPALAPLFAHILQPTGDAAAPATLDCVVEGDASHLLLELTLSPGAAGPPLEASLLDPFLPALRQTFDQVQTDETPAKPGIRLTLTRHVKR